MNIETKFNIDDGVYFFDGDKVKKGKISMIYATYDDVDGVIIDYDIEGVSGSLPEKELFKTTKDLYKHVEKEIKDLLKGE